MGTLEETLRVDLCDIMDVEGEEIAQTEEVVAQEPVEDWNELSALQDVLKRALCHDGIVRGIRECTKYLDKRRAQLCILADNCSEPAYKKLVEALCSEHGVPIMMSTTRWNSANGLVFARLMLRATPRKW